MIKTILVDDEFLVRVRLKSCVDWNELGYEIAGEAANGEEALLLVEEVRPGLAIVDINMPLVSGLDFAGVVRTRYPDTKVVILTGYSSFDYARAALQAGVINYLLKPVIKDELKKILCDLREQIEQETQLKESIENLKINSRERITLLKQKYIMSLLDGSIQNFSEEELEKLKIFCPKLKNEELVVIVAAIDGLLSGGIPEGDGDLWVFAVCNIFNEIFENENCCFEVTYNQNNQIILIVNTVGDNGEKISFLSLCDTVRKLVQEFLKFTITIGTGKVYGELEKIPSSYKEAQNALKNRLILGNNRIIEYEEIEIRKGSAVEALNFRQDMLINLRLGNSAVIIGELHKIFDTFVVRELPLDDLYMVLSELLLTITTFSRENSINIWDMADESINISDLIDSKESIKEIESFFIGIFNKLIKSYSNSRYMGHVRIVDKVKAYIDENYSNSSLGLDNIASNMSINASHLSSIFKKESGVSVTEYLTECRMKHAKELIDAGNKKLFEIAELVGFNDPYYFSKCFKKYTGVSASKYFKTK
ncbi:MAG TPA: response regulator [Ruminiclostridium sp.]|nr:response regulator [Ruminiclostridium sp.]